MKQCGSICTHYLKTTKKCWPTDVLADHRFGATWWSNEFLAAWFVKLLEFNHGADGDTANGMKSATPSHLRRKKNTHTWNLKHPFINSCFNWMIPNLYIENCCFIKHSLKKLLFRVPGTLKENNAYLLTQDHSNHFAKTTSEPPHPHKETLQNWGAHLATAVARP